MKLALVYHQFLHAGGLENYLIEFAKRLAGAGHELVYITSRTTPEVEAKLPGEMILLPRSKGSALLRLWQFSRDSARRAAALKADAVIGFGRTVTQDIHRAGGGCHALYSKLLPFWKRYGFKNLLELHLEKQLYTGGATRHFVTNSHRVSAQLQGVYHTPGERFTTIHTAVDSKLFHPVESRASHREWMCRQMQTDPAAPVLLFVSLNHRRKGLDTLLKALAKTPRCALWIVGKPPGRAHHEIIQRLGLADRVRLVPVTNSVVQLYQAADWFVHPTRYDACANTVLQSMATGLPGVISASDGAVDHVRNGENGLTLWHPDRTDELAALLQKAVSMPEDQRAEMGRQARIDMQQLTWDRHVQEWEDLLARL